MKGSGPFVIGCIAMLLIFKFLIYLFLPSYPKITENESPNNISKKIVEIFESNTRDMRFEALADNRRVPVEYSFALKQTANNLDKCKRDTECIIDEYEDFMDDWTSSSTRKKYRCYYLIHHFGYIGESLCEKLEFFL